MMKCLTEMITKLVVDFLIRFILRMKKVGVYALPEVLLFLKSEAE